MWKELSVYLVLGLIAVLTGGFAWLTHHPDTPWLETAGDLPVIGPVAGPLAERFREAYLPPEVEEPELPLTDVVYVDENGNPIEGPLRLTSPGAVAPGAARAERPSRTERRPLPAAGPVARTTRPLAPEVEPDQVLSPGGRVELGAAPFVAGSWTWFLPGQPLRAENERGSEILARFEAMAYLPVLARSGFWTKVLYGGEVGWVDGTWEPPHDPKAARRGARQNFRDPVRASSRSLLRKVEEILGIPGSNDQLGSYELYTNVKDPELLAFLDSAVEEVEDAYFARYGRLPSGDPERSIALFAARSDYQRLPTTTSGWSGGHATSGVAITFVGDRPRHAVARTLVHEITHLLNRRAFGSRIPTWVEEGLASDLGGVWIEDAAAVIDPSGSGWPAPGAGWDVLGAQGLEAAVLRMAQVARSDRLPPAEELLLLRPEAFYADLNRGHAYSHAAALVRFLIDGEDGALRPGFLAYLDRLAHGHLATPELLTKELGLDFEQLDARFADWLKEESQAIEKRFRQHWKQLR